MDKLGLVIVAVASAGIIFFARRAASSPSARNAPAKADSGGDEQSPVKLVSERAAYERLGCFRLMSMRSKLEQLTTALATNESANVRELAPEVFGEQWKKAADPERVALCSHEEREALGKKFGTWDMNQITDASWRAESAAVLTWALGYARDIPAYDAEADDKKVFSTIKGRPKLRSAAQIGAARDLAELWHWRARTLMLQHGEQPAPKNLPGGMTLDQIVAMTAGELKKQGKVQVKGDDFAAFGKRYRDLGADERSLAMSIAMERHRVLNWLCGYGADWDKVPTDT
jgi:hypothetical protein